MGKNIQKKLIAVDVDGTLCVETCWTPEECIQATPVNHVVEKVRDLHLRNIIIIWTARRDHLMDATKQWLVKNEIPYHFINNQKIPFDVYIDTAAEVPRDPGLEPGLNPGLNNKLFITHLAKLVRKFDKICAEAKKDEKL